MAGSPHKQVFSLHIRLLPSHPPLASSSPPPGPCQGLILHQGVPTQLLVTVDNKSHLNRYFRPPIGFWVGRLWPYITEDSKKNLSRYGVDLDKGLGFGAKAPCHWKTQGPPHPVK